MKSGSNHAQSYLKLSSVIYLIELPTNLVHKRARTMSVVGENWKKADKRRSSTL